MDPIISLFLDLLNSRGSFPVLCVVFLVLLSSRCRIPLNDYKLLVCDIQQLLVAVTIHSCSSSGSQYFRIIEDLITLLGFMQTSKIRQTQGEGWLWNIRVCCLQLRSTVLEDLELSLEALTPVCSQMFPHPSLY